MLVHEEDSRLGEFFEGHFPKCSEETLDKAELRVSFPVG